MPPRRRSEPVQQSVDAEWSLLDFHRQLAALQVGHRDEGPPVSLVDFIDGADIGVLQRGGGASFA